jgi:hypothetical protein
MKPLALFAALLLASAPLAAQAQPRPAPPVGAKVKDDKGKAIGQVEKVIPGPDGQPKQVLVRVDRILRTLPVEALSPSGGDYVSVLSRAEVASLPPSD